MLAQLRAINIANARNGVEDLSSGLLRQVALEEFRIVQPMLNALRSNDTRALTRYDDLIPLQAHFGQALATAVQLPTTQLSSQRPSAPSGTARKAADEGDIPQVLSALCSLGIPITKAKVLVNEARKTEPTEDPMLIMAVIFDRLKQPSSCHELGKSHKKTTAPPPPSDDLRDIVKKGKNSEQCAYDALHAAGLIATPFPDFEK